MMGRKHVKPLFSLLLSNMKQTTLYTLWIPEGGQIIAAICLLAVVASRNILPLKQIVQPRW